MRFVADFSGSEYQPRPQWWTKRTATSHEPRTAPGAAPSHDVSRFSNFHYVSSTPYAISRLWQLHLLPRGAQDGTSLGWYLGSPTLVLSSRRNSLPLPRGRAMCLAHEKLSSGQIHSFIQQNTLLMPYNPFSTQQPEWPFHHIYQSHHLPAYYPPKAFQDEYHSSYNGL